LLLLLSIAVPLQHRTPSSGEGSIQVVSKAAQNIVAPLPRSKSSRTPSR
jgi:hypothetical protein